MQDQQNLVLGLNQFSDWTPAEFRNILKFNDETFTNKYVKLDKIVFK